MLLGGDELGRTQRGNNNAYCQDNEVSWYDWERMDWDIVAFVQKVTALRRTHPQLRRPQFPTGHRRPDGAGDIVWFTAAGTEMTESDWKSGFARSLAVLIDEPDSAEPAKSFYLMLNAAEGAMAFVLPGGTWEIVLETGSALLGSGQVDVEGFTITVLQGR
jgi:glycogen operon protein